MKGKRVLIVGLGRSGLSAARFLLRTGARVSVVDQASRSSLRSLLKKIPRAVAVRAGARRFDPRPFDLLVVSPGVPWNHPDLIQARKAGIPLIPEFELGWRSVSPKKTIVVTGTNGKTTTTALIGHLLRTAGKKTVVAGNIGTPLTEAVPRISRKTILVLELSSYQIEAHRNFKPDIGVWLNLTPDHLGRHQTMARYARIKASLFKNCSRSEVAVLNRRDRWCVKMSRFLPASKKWFPAAWAVRLAKTSPLIGQHNRDNIAAAAAACQLAGLSRSAIKRGIRTFKGVPHRLQPIRTVGGVAYINDSKSTNVDSTIVALKALPKGVHLIVGGRHKGSPYSPLRKWVRTKVRRIYAIGESARLIRKDLAGSADILDCRTIRRAVQAASERARPGETVLLSPACASFDQYRNFEERGRDFVRWVKRVNR